MNLLLKQTKQKSSVTCSTLYLLCAINLVRQMAKFSLAQNKNTVFVKRTFGAFCAFGEKHLGTLKQGFYN